MRGYVFNCSDCLCLVSDSVRKFASFGARFRPLLLLVLGLAPSIPAHAQPLAVNYTGGTYSVNLGSVTVGQSTTQALSYLVTAGTTIGSIEVVYMGSPNLDFTNAGGGSCALQNYGSSASCTVEVKFAPLNPGRRMGAVIFWSGGNNTGSVVGKTLIYGDGQGPMIIYSYGTPSASSYNVTTWGPTVSSSIGFSPYGPNQAAVNGAGDLFVADNNVACVIEIPVNGTPSCYQTPSAVDGSVAPNLGVGFLWLDGAGDLFFDDEACYRTIVDPVGGTPLLALGQGCTNPNNPTVFGVPYYSPQGVGVDAQGNIYLPEIGATNDNYTNPIVFVPQLGTAGTATTFSPAGYPFNSETSGPGSVVQGTQDTLYFTDFMNNKVIVQASGAGSASIYGPNISGISGPLSSPYYAVPDPAGNIYVSDYSNNRAVEIQAGGASGAVLPSFGIASLGFTTFLDGNGSLYFPNASPTGQGILRWNRALSPTVAFPTSTGAGSTDTADGTKTVKITNIGNEALSLTVAYPADFSQDSSDSSSCGSGSQVSVPVNGSCDLPIKFTPQSGGGGKSEQITLSDNAAGGTQTVTVTGTATGGVAPAITSANSTTFTQGTAGSFTVTTTGSPNAAIGEAGLLPSGVTFTDNGNGTATLSGTPASAGPFYLTITANNGTPPNATQTFTLNVNAAAATHFVVSAPSTQTAGSSFSVTVTAETAGNATAIGYSGTVHFTSSDGSAVMPANSTLTNGVGMFNVTLKTAGSQNVGATDTATSSITGSASVSVNAAAAASMTLVATSAPSFFQAFNFTVTAYDSFGNVATGDNDTVAITYNVPGYCGVGNLTLSSGTVSGGGACFKTAGASDTVYATDTSNSALTGSATFNIAPGPASYLGVAAPSSTYAGSPVSVAVAAYDFYGNVATGYAGTVAFTSSDGAASLPGNATLINGTQTFSVTLATVGSQSITATDTVTGSIQGTSGSISVTIPNYMVTVASDDAGTASNCTIQATPGANTADASCSLRDALLAANSIGSGNITFASAPGQLFATPQTIALTNGTLSIPSNTTVTGATSGSGAGLTNLVAVSGAGSYTVFTVSSGVSAAAIGGLTITDGYATYGGGIYNNGALTISNSTLSGNTASSQGGGIYANGGSLTVLDSTFSANSTVNGGGAAIFGINETLNVNRGTFSGNSSAASGGAMVLTGNSTIGNSTFSGNKAPNDGGAIYAPQGALTVSNSIFSGNSAARGAGILSENQTVNASYSLFYNNVDTGGGEDDCFDCASNGNEVTTNPNLAPLGSYGGPTQTMVPLPGSGAICAASAALIPAGSTADQRGFPDSTTYGSTVCYDAGAVQSNYVLSFNPGPPSSFVATVAMSPAPVVQLTESNVPATLPTSTVTMSDNLGYLSGTITANLSSGAATFSNIIVSTATTSDALTATLSLNPNLAAALNLAAESGTFQATAPQPAVSLSTNALAYGSLNEGEQSASQQVTVTNTGSATLSISSIAVTGTNASSFLFGNTGYIYPNGCGTTLAVGASCVIHGHFAPIAVGPLAAAVSIADNAPNSPQTITVGGTGIAAPVVNLSAASIDYGSVNEFQQSASKYVVLENTGDAPLEIASITVAGRNPTSFVFADTAYAYPHGCGPVVPARSGCWIHGHFLPVAAGALEATVKIVDNAAGSPQKIVVTGTAAAEPLATLSAASITFVSQAVGTTSSSQSVTLTNKGGAPLSISSIAVTGADASSFIFSNSCGPSLGRGVSCTIHGHFKPTATGPLTAAITISDNSATSPQTIQLGGTGQ